MELQLQKRLRDFAARTNKEHGEALDALKRQHARQLRSLDDQHKSDQADLVREFGEREAEQLREFGEREGRPFRGSGSRRRTDGTRFRQGLSMSARRYPYHHTAFPTSQPIQSFPKMRARNQKPPAST